MIFVNLESYNNSALDYELYNRVRLELFVKRMLCSFVKIYDKGNFIRLYDPFICTSVINGVYKRRPGCGDIEHPFERMIDGLPASVFPKSSMALNSVIGAKWYTALKEGLGGYNYDHTYGYEPSNRYALTKEQLTNVAANHVAYAIWSKVTANKAPYTRKLTDVIDREWTKIIGGRDVRNKTYA